MKILAIFLLSTLTIGPATARADSGWAIQQMLLRPDGRYPLSINSVSMLDANIGIAVGSRSLPSDATALVLTTNDGGRHWNGVSFQDRIGFLVKVQLIDQTTAIAVGEFIYRTIDRGSSWTRVSFQFGMSGVSFTDAKTGTAVGSRGIILRSTDGGLNWTPQSSGTTDYLLDVSSLDSNTAIAVGDRGTILRTIDGGATWTFQTSGTTNQLRAVSFADDWTGIAVGSGGTILLTKDGGQTWNAQMSGTSADLVGVAHSDNADTVFVAGTGTILRTTDGGASWLAQELPSVVRGYRWAGISSKGGIGIAVNAPGDGVILRTTTDGEPVTCALRVSNIDRREGQLSSHAAGDGTGREEGGRR
jgi:photosystem II stability/assembly factor-like uncharacterized protein